MIIDDICFELKDGRKAVLRNPGNDDVESTLEYLVKSSGETDFLLRYPEECSMFTPEGERKLFEQKNLSEDELMLVCIVDGKLAGNCALTFKNKIKTRHRAIVAIALLREFWNQGIGTKMFQEMLHIAESREEIMQVELEVIQGNERAMHLYEKMGFKVTGTHPNAIRLKDGTLLDEYTMMKEIHR